MHYALLHRQGFFCCFFYFTIVWCKRHWTNFGLSGWTGQENEPLLLMQWIVHVLHVLTKARYISEIAQKLRHCKIVVQNHNAWLDINSNGFIISEQSKVRLYWHLQGTSSQWTHIGGWGGSGFAGSVLPWVVQTWGHTGPRTPAAAAEDSSPSSITGSTADSTQWNHSSYHSDQTIWASPLKFNYSQCLECTNIYNIYRLYVYPVFFRDDLIFTFSKISFKSQTLEYTEIIFSNIYYKKLSKSQKMTDAD